jgi:hypothetical protein
VLGFTPTLGQVRVATMLAIMFNLHFKNMKIIWDFVGDSLALQVVAKYDTQIVYPLLVQTYFHLNPMKAVVESVVVEDDDNPFGKIFIMMMQSCQP